MKLKLLAIAALLLFASPLSAQWTYLGEATAGTTSIEAHNGVIVATGNTTKVSTDAGNTWTDAGGRAASALWVGDGFFVGNNTSENFKTDAQGLNWQRRGYISYTINDLFFDSTNGALYAATMRGNAVLKSTDTGGHPSTNTWLPVGGGSQDLTSIHARGNRIMAYYNGIVGLSPGMLSYTLDGGANWLGKSWPYQYNGEQFGFTTGAYVARNGDLYATAARGPGTLQYTNLYRSRNDGATWDSLFVIKKPTPILHKSILYVEGSRIVVSGGVEVWLSEDDGATWKQMKEGIQATATGSIRDMALDNGNIYIVSQAFTNGQTGFGIYRRPMADFGFTGIAAVSPTVDAGISLRVSNSSDGTSRALLTLEASQNLTLSLCDVLGRQTSVLFEGLAKPGMNTFEIPHRSGVQFVRAIVGGKELVAKLVR